MPKSAIWRQSHVTILSYGNRSKFVTITSTISELSISIFEDIADYRNVQLIQANGSYGKKTGYN